jgi:hypothetical protein
LPLALIVNQVQNPLLWLPLGPVLPSHTVFSAWAAPVTPNAAPAAKAAKINFLICFLSILQRGEIDTKFPIIAPQSQLIALP